MADFNVRSDSIDVEHIMHQIRARIREKRGVDYTEQQIRELATVKLERFLDPDGIRSDLLDQFQRARQSTEPLPNYVFEDTTLFESHRAPIRFMRRLLNPILKLFFNPNPLIQALHIQSQLNQVYSKGDTLYFELIHNLVVEMTRLSIEVKNLKMRVESLSSRLDFNERRARALEGVVQFKPAQTPPREAPARQDAVGERPAGEQPASDAMRTRRRRRRRGRRGGGQGQPSGVGESHAPSTAGGSYPAPAAAPEAPSAPSSHEESGPDFDAPPADQ
jgi:hypothetical protein